MKCIEGPLISLNRSREERQKFIDNNTKVKSEILETFMGDNK